MSFLTPAFFWFLALIPLVILLYLLKLRRTEIIISSTFLWIKSLQDLTANSPFQRLRKNLLLLLQIIVITLIVIALARPFVRAETARGASYCLLIDRSASMQTREGDQTRLDIAKEKALQFANNLQRGDKMMVVAFAQSAEVLCELTDDTFRLRRAINGIETSDTRSNIRDVILIARSLSPDNPDIPATIADLQLVLLSDGKLSDLADVGATAPDMTYLKIGETANNAGIVGFNVRRATEGGADQQTFVLVHNESAAQLDTTMTLYFQDAASGSREAALAVEEVKVAAGESQEVLFSHPDLGSGILRAELDHEDALAVDNSAWLALQPETRIRVLLVSEPESTSGYYIQRALALEPRVELSSIAPTNYVGADEYDLVVFDKFAPETLPAGSLLFFDALPPIAGLSESGEMEQPPVLGKEGEHPVMRFLNPGNIGIRSARRVTLPEGARTLLSTTAAPLIADVSQGDQQILVVTFDIADSGWPLELSFPLFVQNVVSWAPRAALASELAVQTGRPITILPSPDHTEATIERPDGRTETVQLDPIRPVYYGATDVAGVYTVRRGDDAQRYAVNLLDRNESAITPADEFNVGRGAVRAVESDVIHTRELWRWFLLAALAVLALEWWIYSRRAWI